jgi:hypothetical protein
VKASLQRTKPLHKVMFILQDNHAVGRVYVLLKEPLSSKDMLIEAMKRLEQGRIYADVNCKKLIDDDYIEIYDERPISKKNEDFIFLIDRLYAHEYIVAAKIIK